MKIRYYLYYLYLIGAVFVAVALSNKAVALEQIIRPYQSARSAGMGGVRYTTGIYDENFFGNPARAAYNPNWRIDILNVFAEVNSGALKNYEKLTSEGDTVEKIASTAGTNNHVRVQTVMPAFYFPHAFSPKHSLQFGLIHSTQVDVDLRRNLQVDPLVISDIGPALTYARRLLKNRLVIGATTHLTYRVATKQTYSTIDYIRAGNFKVRDASSEGAHIDFDLGTVYDIPWSPGKWDLKAGFAANQLMDGRYNNIKLDFVKGQQSIPRKQPRTFNGGLTGTKKGLGIFSALTLAAEVQDVGNNPNGSLFRTLHFGGELDLFDWMHVRGGINQGYWAAGFGMELKIFTIDVASYGEEMTLNPGGMEDRRYAVKVSLGI